MIDVRLLRNDPEMVRNLMARRHKPELLTQLDEAHRLDARLREITSERDATRAQVNDISKQVGALRKAGDTAAAEAAMAQTKVRSTLMPAARAALALKPTILKR